MALGLEILSGEGRIEVLILTVDAFALGLLQDVDLLDHCKKHIFDVAARTGRGLEVLHLVLLQHLLQKFGVVVAEWK